MLSARPGRGKSVCRQLPQKYGFKESPAVTDTVCMVTHRPPKAGVPEQMQNRVETSVKASSSQQPLESSRIPVTATCTAAGRIQKIHRFRNASRTRKSTTQPHTVAMTVIAVFRAEAGEWGLVFVSLDGGGGFPRNQQRRKQRAHDVDAPQRPRHPPAGEHGRRHAEQERRPRVAAKRKAAVPPPVLSACPLRNAAATFCAPTGYPPRNAGISRDSAPSGIPNSRPKGRRTAEELPSRELVSRMDSTKKGNSEGITVRRHSSMP